MLWRFKHLGIQSRPKTGRFDENTRWTGLLQQKLGPEYHIIEEGLCGRTTVFQDELRESRRGLDMVGVTVEMHNPLDLVIIMLGTNDCKSRYRASASADMPRGWIR